VIYLFTPRKYLTLPVFLFSHTSRLPNHAAACGLGLGATPPAGEQERGRRWGAGGGKAAASGWQPGAGPPASEGRCTLSDGGERARRRWGEG
jgi:hypothetical protein